MRNKINAAVALTVISFTYCLTSCSTKKENGMKTAGVDIANFDTTITPGQDFFQYVNGSWLKNNPVPATESRWGSFSEVKENNMKVLKEICESAASNKDAKKGSNEQKIGDIYATGMDSAKLEADGIKPLLPEFDRINAIKDINGVITTTAYYQTMFLNPMFSFFAGQDDKNSSVIVPQLRQGGIGLPDRDYYSNTDERSANIRSEYVKHIAKLFELTGSTPAEAKANADVVMKIETNLANSMLTRVEMRDPNRIYNKKNIAELDQLTPNIHWGPYLNMLNVKTADYAIVDHPEFYQKVNEMLGTVSVNDWKTYLKWNVISGLADALNNEMVMEEFHFNEEILKGTKQIKPRYKRVIEMTDNLMGEALGELYCSKAFTPETKARALEMVNNLGIALKERIEKLDWMDAPTKEKAQAKLAAFIKKIGYPDKWRDYSKLDIDRTSYASNIMHASQFEYNRMVAKIGRPIDKNEWGMSPPTVNAYYNPGFNEIVFPAGILQPPFFNADADDAVNYGGIGAVIGHEMTHGFDDQGRQYDAEGNLKNWWSTQDSSNFMGKAQKVVDQFNNSIVVDTLHANGSLTLGENIADLGGITIAYEAFKKTKQGQSDEKIDGFTPTQRFFLGWATVWRQNVREEELRRRLIVDPHSPGKLRCNEPLSNMPEFYEAFNIKETDKMWRKESDRARIW
ncbi:MAG: M13 family metallopeptidase [Bacteroidia bacterium]